MVGPITKSVYRCSLAANLQDGGVGRLKVHVVCLLPHNVGTRVRHRMKLVAQVVRPVVVVVVHLGEDLAAGRSDASVQALPQRDLPRRFQEHHVPEPGPVGEFRQLLGGEPETVGEQHQFQFHAVLSGQGPEDTVQVLGPDSWQQHRQGRPPDAGAAAREGVLQDGVRPVGVGVARPDGALGQVHGAVVQLRAGDQRAGKVFRFLAGGGHRHRCGREELSPWPGWARSRPEFRMP